MLTIVSFQAFSQKKVKLKDRTDSISYAVGVSMYQGVKQFNHELDFKKISEGMIAASEDEARMEPKAAQEYIQKVEADEKQKLILANKEIEKNFLVKNKEVEGVIETASGLQYKVIDLGTGNKPGTSDRVKVHYSGYLIDGSKFDSSYDRDMPAVFGVSQVIKGWTEVLQLMPVGSVFKAYIPAELAYGDRQMGADIPPASLLIFDIELLDIEN